MSPVRRFLRNSASSLGASAHRLQVLAVFTGLLMLPATPALEAAVGTIEYGEATLRRGTMTVLRGGVRQLHRGAGEKVAIFHGDVIRVGPRSRVVLETVEKATLTLGGNAIFQVKPWRRREKRGLLRMLFGRFRAKIVALSGGERFNVSTATATIGVKGTAYTAAVLPQGDVLLLVTENLVQLEGRKGAEQNVPEGSVSTVIGAGAAHPAAVATPELLSALAEEGLDAPSPNSPEALHLPAEQELIELGLVSRRETEASSRAGEGTDPDATPPAPTTSATEAEGQRQEDENEAGPPETAPPLSPPEPTIPTAAEEALENIEQTTQDAVNEGSGARKTLQFRFEK